MHEADNFHYYKIPVPFGTTMNDGEVSRACTYYDMEPVCVGPSGCSYNTGNCKVTPLSTICGSAMSPLSKLLCDGQNPNQCPIMDQMFSVYTEDGKGDRGAVDGKWYVEGINHTSTKEKPLFAYCTKDSMTGKFHPFKY